MKIWSDSRKFWAESIRTIILAGLGVLGVYLIVEPLKNKRAYEAELDKERLSIKSKLIDQFLNSSHKFTAIASDACNGDPGAMQQYENELRDIYTNDRTRLSLYFTKDDTIQKELASIYKLDSLLHRYCKDGASVDLWEPVRSELKSRHLKLVQRAMEIIKLK